MSYLGQLLGENEKIVLVTRQSWTVLVREALVDLFLALIVVGVTSVVSAVLGPPGLLTILLLAVPVALFVVEFLKWANRQYIVSNRRVIQIDGVINKNVIDSSLEKVNDVRMTQSLLGRLLNFGDVEILTASELGVNAFRNIANPIRFKTAMLNQKEKLTLDEMSETAASAPATPASSDIPSLIAGLSALRQQGVITEEEFQKKKAELLARM